MSKKFYTIISMMSGTSMDGVDACLVNLSDEYDFEIKGFYTLEYPADLREALLRAATDKASVSDVCVLNIAVGEHFAKCVNKLLEKYELSAKDINFISSHGQTIWHAPKPCKIGGYDITSTLQIGDISQISEKTGILTIGDFRPKDMAAGGQGAPLVPYADEILFGKSKNVCVQNIGGISNVTVISKNCDTFAFDNGVGNMLSDYFSLKFFDKPYDKDGNFAKQGTVDEKVLKILLQDDYYSQKPPKSTGREHFNDEYAEKMISLFEEKNPCSIIRTSVELTAKTIFDSYCNFVFPKTSVDEVIIGGGGAFNPVLMQTLQKYFDDIPVKTHEDYGIQSKFKECLAFAVLGLNTFLRRTNNLPCCTGASKKVVMGKISYAE